ncbi:MAG: hypothetical protein RLZ68_1307 [Pseudomonadota bacterium]|jgi:hypothetical protein
MLLLKLAYFGSAVFLFLLASSPFLDEMRNGESFFSNLRKLQKEKRKGSSFLALTFFNLMLSFLSFLFIN